jgi:hypothetical protein
VHRRRRVKREDESREVQDVGAQQLTEPPWLAEPASPQPDGYAARMELAPSAAPPASGGIYSAGSVEALLRRRVDTDVELKFSNYMLWTIVLTIFTAGIGTVIYNFVILWRLVNRQTEHFARQQALLDKVVSVQREFAQARGISTADGSIGRSQGILSEIRIHEGARNPWVHAVIGPILTLSLWVFYTAYFLTLDWRRHADRHCQLEEELAAGFRGLGLRNASITDMPNVPQRNYWVFLILTFVTLGLFGFVWVYFMMADGNNHMKHHAFVEDQIVGMVRELERR